MATGLMRTVVLTAEAMDATEAGETITQQEVATATITTILRTPPLPQHLHLAPRAPQNSHKAMTTPLSGLNTTPASQVVIHMLHTAVTRTTSLTTSTMRSSKHNSSNQARARRSLHHRVEVRWTQEAHHLHHHLVLLLMEMLALLHHLRRVVVTATRTCRPRQDCSSCQRRSPRRACCSLTQELPGRSRPELGARLIAWKTAR